jgi:hypothetical protein
MVNLHFLSLIEALQEINSIVLANVSDDGPENTHR